MSARGRRSASVAARTLLAAVLAGALAAAVGGEQAQPAVGAAAAVDEKATLIGAIVKLAPAEAGYPLEAQAPRKLSAIKKNLKFSGHVFLAEVNLRNYNVTELRLIKDVVSKEIQCTYAYAAQTVFAFFDAALAQGPATLNLNTVKEFAKLVQTTAVTWRRAIASVRSTGVDPDPWLWQVLLYTNTVVSVAEQTYPGMSAVDDDDALAGRIVFVHKTLVKWTADAASNCRGDNKTGPWDLTPRTDETVYEKVFIDTLNERLTAPAQYKYLSNVTSPLYGYVTRLEKLMYRNSKRNTTTTEGYDGYDPKVWFLDTPTLESFLVNETLGNMSWDNVRTDLKFYVTPVSNHDWITNYNNAYFDAASNVLDAMPQVMLVLTKQQCIACKDQWYAIKNSSSPSVIEQYSFKCSRMANSIYLIILACNLTNTITEKMNTALQTRFTLDSEFDTVIDAVDEEMKKMKKIYIDSREGENSYVGNIGNYPGLDSDSWITVFESTRKFFRFTKLGLDIFKSFKKSFYGKYFFYTILNL